VDRYRTGARAGSPRRSGLRGSELLALDGKPGDFQIRMGAASDAYTSVLSLGMDRPGDRLHAIGIWTHDGRVTRLPVRVLRRTPSVIVLEAGGLPLADRPQSLKCWSFLRQLGTDHYSKVKESVSADLEAHSR
jgi:hypothetical protein